MLSLWPERDLDGFTDGGDTPEWAKSYVRSLVGQGIINGYEDGTLKPNASMMRGEGPPGKMRRRASPKSRIRPWSCRP